MSHAGEAVLPFARPWMGLDFLNRTPVDQTAETGPDMDRTFKVAKDLGAEPENSLTSNIDESLLGSHRLHTRFVAYLYLGQDLVAEYRTPSFRRLPAVERSIDLESEIQRLVSLGDSIPGKGVLAKSDRWLNELHDFIGTVGLPWYDPNITIGVDGEIVFEWWSAEYKLTIYVDQSEVYYVRSWGTSLEKEMDDGYFSHPSDILNAWTWMYAPRSR